MSRLEWPTNLGAANGFATAAADQRGTVYPHHVVLADKSNKAGTDIANRDFDDLEVVGVSLDLVPPPPSNLPLSWPETRKPAEPSKRFAYAITGVVPVVVPSGVLETAHLGQPLYILKHDPQQPYFGEEAHHAPQWTLDPNAGAKKVGVIVGLGGTMENHCLIVLSYW